jgi:hypothetical protein
MTVYIIALLIFAVFMFIKNENTYRVHTKVIDAIHKYRMFCIYNAPDQTEQVSVFDIEPYAQTLFRLWGWGYKRILPAEKYELIKEFLITDDET